MELTQMFKEIKDYHKTLGYDYENIVSNDRIKVIRELCLALHQEVAELTDSFPWKPWRPIEDQPDDEYNATTEIVDILFFLGAIMETTDIKPEDIKDMFYKKLKENYRRIKSGYNNKPNERR